MAAERLSMRKTKEILRLKLDAKLSNRHIGISCKVSPATVSDCLGRFKASGLAWPLPEDMSEFDLENRLYSNPNGDRAECCSHAPNWHWVHRELRKKHVTLMLLWQEYKQANPQGVQYSWFCEKYHAFNKTLDPVMRQEHKFGHKCFVDYAGTLITVKDPLTGEAREATLFVGVLGASNYTYVEASWGQNLPSWISAHVRMFEYFGGVPEILVPDNLKSGVKTPDYYEPDLNPTYQEMAEHYGTAVVPARKRHPKDKAKVENGVLIAERWILAALRNRTFFSLTELNQAISLLLEELNSRRFQKLPGSRRSVFEQEERKELLPLPVQPFQYQDRRRAKVNIDYHIEVEGHYYSVPYNLIGQYVEARWTSTAVAILHEGARVASHMRSFAKGKHTTCPDHMPPRHRWTAEWTPERIVKWAAKTGESTSRLMEEIMARRAHPEQGFRSCLGVMRLASKYGEKRLEAACHRALCIGAFSYRSIKSILDKNLDKQPVQPLPQPVQQPRHHVNVRGAEYYQ